MSLFPIVLIALGVVVSLAVLLSAAALVSPVIFTVDSRGRQVRIRWLWALEYARALPGTGGTARLSVAGRPVSLHARERKRGPEKAAAAAGKPQRDRSRRRRLLRRAARCLSDPVVRRALARQLWRLGKGISRSFALTSCRTSLSLPDPAWNGMLAGVSSQFPWSRKFGVRATFTGENSLWLEVRVYPHRVVKALLLFLPGLPYRAMYRGWRASSTTAP